MGHFSGILRLGLLASVLLVSKGNGIQTESPLQTTTAEANGQEEFQALPKEVLRQVIEMVNITSRIFQCKAPVPDPVESSVTTAAAATSSAAAVAATAADGTDFQGLLLSLWESKALNLMLRDLLQLKDELTKLKEENSKKTEEEDVVKGAGCPPCPLHQRQRHCYPRLPLTSTGVRMSLGDSSATSCAQFQETQNTILREIEDISVYLSDLSVDRVICNKPSSDTEQQKQWYARDCYDLFESGEKTSGTYKIYPQKFSGNYAGVEVWCDMGESESHDDAADLGTETGEGGGGGWTVIIKRQPVSDPVNFTRDWDTYKLGFGEPQTEYYIGNDNLHALTSGGRPQALRVEITDWDGVSKYASYGSFSVASELDNFRLSVGNFSSTRSTAGDSLTQGPDANAIHNGMEFSTYDKDNDKSPSSCAKWWKSGMWFNSCHYASPTNPLLGKQESWYGMNWYTFYGDYTTMKKMIWKIKTSGLPGV